MGQSNFDYRDPYMIRSHPKGEAETPLNPSRPKANSYTLNYKEKGKSRFKGKHSKNNKSKEANKIMSNLGKKIIFLKSKKNSIKREELSQSKQKKDFKGFQKKMKIRLDISQKMGKFRDGEAEPVALKSCSMKNTISKFKFEYPLENKNFEFRPNFKESHLKLLNESKREKSINLIYKGKSKLKRNHTTKLLRNISYYQDPPEGKYVAKKSESVRVK